MPQKKERILDVTLEEALGIIEEMPGHTKEDKGNLVIYTGTHPKHGEVYVMLPPLGNPVVLPVVLQKYD